MTDLLSNSLVIEKIKNSLPVLSILGAVFLWASSFSAMRIVLKDLSPYAVMFCRLFLACIAILPVFIRTLPQSYKKGDWKILFTMVICQPCMYFLLESNALKLTTSSQAGIISACLPLMVAAAAFIFLSEPIAAKTITGLFLSIFGVIMLTIFQESTSAAPRPVLGNFLETCAMISACINMILIKKLTRRYDTWFLTGLQVFGGAIFFSPGFFSLHLTNASIWTTKFTLTLFYLGGCVSFLSFGLFNWGIGRTEASKASVFINLIPIIAIFLGWAVLDEYLNLNQIFAACLVIGGVFISNRQAATE